MKDFSFISSEKSIFNQENQIHPNDLNFEDNNFEK